MSPPDPGAILTMWAAGVAAGVAVVAWWRVARPGFVLLGAAVAALIGGLGALAGAGIGSWIGVLFAILAMFLRIRAWAAIPLAIAMALLLFRPTMVWGIGPAITGAVALGGISSEMLLGHWYLVDPKLARWPLRRLAVVGAVGVGVDAILVQTSPESIAVSAVVLLALAVTSVLLMVAVWFALKGRSYTGVMAATGLSYLATLTSLGAVVVGRANL